MALTIAAATVLILVLSLALAQQLSETGFNASAAAVPWLWGQFAAGVGALAVLVAAVLKQSRQNIALSAGDALSEQMSRQLPPDDVSLKGAPANYLKSLRALQFEVLDMKHKEQVLIERAVDVICVINTNATIHSINRACERQWGYTPRELTGQSISLILPEATVEGIKTAVLGTVRSIDRVNLETQIKRKDGSTVDVVWTGYWSAREPGLFSIVHDISEQKQMERLKDEFFAMVSHDLKNPLTSVIGLLGLMERGVLGDINEKGKKIAAGAHSECSTMLRLLDDFLQIEKIKAGMFQLQPSEFLMKNAVDKAISTMSAQATEKQIAFETGCDTTACVADEQRIQQVLANLIGNALKFSPENGCIRIESHAKGDEVLVSVQDQGRGIPPEMLRKIFAKFEQVETDDSRRFGGTGLGLAICKAIVEQHGGQIGVESEPGKGSRFWFTIPTKFTPS